MDKARFYGGPNFWLKFVTGIQWDCISVTFLLTSNQLQQMTYTPWAWYFRRSSPVRREFFVPTVKCLLIGNLFDIVRSLFLQYSTTWHRCSFVNKHCNNTLNWNRTITTCTFYNTVCCPNFSVCGRQLWGGSSHCWCELFCGGRKLFGCHCQPESN